MVFWIQFVIRIIITRYLWRLYVWADTTRQMFETCHNIHAYMYWRARYLTPYSTSDWICFIRPVFLFGTFLDSVSEIQEKNYMFCAAQNQPAYNPWSCFTDVFHCPPFNPRLNCIRALQCIQHVLYYCYLLATVMIIAHVAVFNLRVNCVYVSYCMHCVFLFYTSGYKQQRASCEHHIIQPMAELHPGFTARASGFCIVAPQLQIST